MKRKIDPPTRTVLFPPTFRTATVFVGTVLSAHGHSNITAHSMSHPEQDVGLLRGISDAKVDESKLNLCSDVRADNPVCIELKYLELNFY